MPPAFALSQDQTLKFIPFKTHLAKSSISLQTKRKPKLTYSQRTPGRNPKHAYSKRFCTHSKRNTSDNASDHDNPICKLKQLPKPKPDHQHHSITEAKAPATEPVPPVTQQEPETPPTYPFPAYSIVKQQISYPQHQPTKTAPFPVPQQPTLKAWSAFYSRPASTVNKTSYTIKPSLRLTSPTIPRTTV